MPAIDLIQPDHHFPSFCPGATILYLAELEGAGECPRCRRGALLRVDVNASVT